jgi:hypothetical protein
VIAEPLQAVKGADTNRSFSTSLVVRLSARLRQEGVNPHMTRGGPKVQATNGLRGITSACRSEGPYFVTLTYEPGSSDQTVRSVLRIVRFNRQVLHRKQVIDVSRIVRRDARNVIHDTIFADLQVKAFDLYRAIPWK